MHKWWCELLGLINYEYKRCILFILTDAQSSYVAAALAACIIFAAFCPSFAVFYSSSVASVVYSISVAGYLYTILPCSFLQRYLRSVGRMKPSHSALFSIVFMIHSPKKIGSARSSCSWASKLDGRLARYLGNRPNGQEKRSMPISRTRCLVAFS